MSDLDDSLTNWNKRAALEEVESLKLLRSNGWDEHTHSFRWLMASLLGINGAAALGMLGQEDIPLECKFVSGSFFIFGIIAALLVAVFGQKSMQNSIVPIQKLIGYWITVSVDGVRDEQSENELGEELRRSAKTGIVSRIAGWVSVFAFLLGSVWIGVGLKRGTTEEVGSISSSSNLAPTPPLAAPTQHGITLP